MDNNFKPLYHSDINETFIIEPLLISNEVISACTAVISNNLISCSGDSQIHLSNGETIFNTNITPENDEEIDIGTNLRRFRDINTVSGSSTIWTSSIKINTPNLNLGLDSLGEYSEITANNSIVQNDILYGGSF